MLEVLIVRCITLLNQATSVPMYDTHQSYLYIERRGEQQAACGACVRVAAVHTDLITRYYSVVVRWQLADG
jgi:hypothetical protein